MSTATIQTDDAWKTEARRNLEYARRLRYTDPKLCMSILIDVLDRLLSG
ncbi:MAG: hypothetical protein ABSF09_09670 [Candidatus Bathyarchaeia archaeon]